MKKPSVYVDFMDLQKVYDMVNKAVLWQVLRIYDGDRVTGNLRKGKLCSLFQSLFIFNLHKEWDSN